MAAALLWGLAALAALILAALALPIHVALEARTSPERRVRLRIAPFAGALALPAIERPSARVVSRATDVPLRRDGAGRGKAGRSRRSGRRSPAVRLVRLPVRAVLRDLRRGLRLGHIELDARIGLGDPAETGRLWGWLAAILYGLPRPARAEISLAPAFGEATLEGTLAARGEVRLVPLAVLGLRLLWVLRGPSRGGA